MSSTVASSLGPSANIMTNGKQPKLETKPSGMGAKGISAANGPSSTTSGVSEKHESWQMELLMERLRSKAKSSQYKSFQEMSKSARMSLLEKRYALDAVEKSNLQKTLDSMQYCIKVTSRQGLVERLDCLTRQLGLKLSEDTSGLFISSDMFYLEIILDQNGTVQDVKVHHECKMKQQSCSELVSCLQRGDFVDFTTQLEGLASIYQLNAEKKIKVNAFVALQALETDLYNLYSLSTPHFSDIHSLLLKSPLGVVQKRRGGHAMKLTYFVAPYDLLDLEAKKMKPLNTELLSAEKIGYSVSVNLEASTANKLQIQPLLVQQGNSPMYSPIEKHNSTSLPATFVLRLNKPIALNVAALKQITAITGDTSVGTADKDQSSSMMSLIIQHDSNGAINNVAKGLFVTLPDQYHCYYMSENKNVQGVIVSSIPFTEPQHVPKILVFLRQQALFNQLLTSCIRNNGSSNTRISDYENLLVFEIAALSCQNITVSLEHPYEESLAMVELDLRNSLAIQVRIFCNGYECDDIISHRISLVMQRTISIPITLRALIKIWELEYEAKFKGKLGLNAGGNSGNDESNFSLPMGPDEGGGNGSGGPGGGGGGSGLGLNGQHSGSMNGVVIAHQECSDAKKIKLEPLDSAKKRRTGEDFRHSPKSSKVETKGRNGDDVPEVEKDDDCDESTNTSIGDSSNSLGGNQSNAAQQTSSSSSLLSSSGISMSVETPGDSNQLLTNKSVENNDFSSLDAELVRSSNSSDAAGSNESSLVLKKNHALKPADEKPSFTSSVSITPIAVGKPNLASNSVLNIGLDKRPGIEIIPLASAGSSMSSSVTITPIPIGSSIGSSKSGGSSEKRVGGTSITGSGTSRKSSESDRAKLEKKKKRKHEEQLAQLQMGPPHKILSKTASSDGPTSPSGSSRKFTASPVPSKSGGTSSGQHLTGGSPSPKHSPVHHSSPKHQGNYGTSSPKHVSGGSSGGGKPSMSALKSAASGGSPSSKASPSGTGGKEEGPSSSSSSAGLSNKTSSGAASSRDRDRERERERSDKKSGYSSSSSSPKLKSPAVKLKQLDLANCGASLSSGVQLELMNSNSSGGSSAGSCSIDFSDTGLFGANATDLSKSSSVAAASAASMLLLQHAMKNKKSSLSAVIDKLKSAHSGDESTLMLLPELAQQAGFTIKETSISGKSASPSTTASTTIPVSNLSASSSAATTTASFAAHLSGSTVQGKSNEYMVKPSSDGIKLTIQNKKGSKSSSSSSASSKSSSKSGLKPGVSSGPVSKKLQSSQSFSGSFPSTSSSSSSSKSSSSGSSSSKLPFQKSSSSGSLLNTGSSLKPSSKSSSNSSSSSSSSGSKDKSRSSSKSSSSSSSSSTLMTTNMAVNALNALKMIGFTPSIQNMEGFVKTLDTKFQIPKLSARSGVSGSDTDKLKDSRPASSSAPNTPLSNVSQSPTGANDFSLPFNKLPGDVSPLHSAMLPNVMQKMFSAHDNAMLLRRSPNLDHQTSNSRDGFPSLYGKGPTTPTTPTASVAPSFPSPVGLQGHAMDFSSSSDSIDGSNLMRPPSRPSSTLSNHSSSDKLIDGTASSNSMDGLSSSSSAQAITAAAVAAQFINKLDNTQHTQLVAALKNHHLNALSNAAAAAAAAAASNSAGSVPVTSPASVSVHIVKSPAASPLPLHGGAGNAVDDELMDEALIGISGK